ncbi:MAG: phosphoenolpyruvate carboxykinase, partial [Oscillospiraceae bacterium]
MALTKHKEILGWIDEMAAMTRPDSIVWIDGSQEQLELLRKEACATGEIIKLNEEKLPGCYLHRTAVNDVARVEDRTYICCRNEQDAGPTNHWMAPEEMYAKLKKLYAGAMSGRT